MIDARTSSYPDARVQGGENDDGSLTGLIDSIFNIIQRRRFVIGALVLLGMACAHLITKTTPTTYMAFASVIIEDQRSQVADVQVDPNKGFGPTRIDSEVETMRVPELATRVVDNLQLHKLPEFNPTLRQPTRMDKLMGRDGPRPVWTEQQAKAVAANMLRGRMSFRRVGMTDVISVGARARNPQVAAAIANGWAEAYLQSKLDAKLASTRQASQWLSQQVIALQAEVKRQSAAVQAERAASGLIVGGGGSVADQQVRNLSAELSAARAQLSEREARFGTSQGLGRGGGAASAGEVLSSPLIMGLRNRETDANRKIAELSIRYGPQHPQMQTARQEAADIQRQLREETARIVKGNASELEVARRRVAAVQADLDRWTGTLTQDTRRASRLQQLEGQAAATSRTYESYVQRLQQVNDLEKLQRPDARIVSRAQPPRGPASPNGSQNMALGFLTGLFGAVIAAAILEFLERGVRSPKDVEYWARTPCLASIPRLMSSSFKELQNKGAKGPADSVAMKPLSIYSESFRQMRADLILAPVKGRVPQIILFSSAVANEGKSTTALAFARTLAMAGSKVLLLEADMRRPSISAVSGLTATSSLIDAIGNIGLLDSGVQTDTLTPLQVLPSLPVYGRIGVDQALERIDEFYKELRTRFDYVVVDTAPILAVAETQVLARAADAVVLIARWGVTQGEALRLAVRELAATRIAPRGVVLNSVNVAMQSRYTAGDSSAYYKYFKDYYVQ
jgi:capsular exopolysaccharide synthesis family protein